MPANRSDRRPEINSPAHTLSRTYTSLLYVRIEYGVHNIIHLSCSQNIMLLLISGRIRRRAEVSSYFDRHDEAETLFREIDRKDLAVSLRERLGDWFRVVQVRRGIGAETLIAVG